MLKKNPENHNTIKTVITCRQQENAVFIKKQPYVFTENDERWTEK